MSENPFQSPQTDDFNQPADNQRQKLRDIAKYQRWVIMALLVNILLYVAAGATRTSDVILIRAMIGVAFICVALFAMVAVVLLARQLMDTVVAVICGLAMIIPCVSLIVLLIVNQKATSELQRHGIKVGFLGTDFKSI